MAIKYGFFNSAAGDTRQYNADDFAKRFAMLFTDGVSNGNNQSSLAVSPNGLGVNVATGFAHIKGYHIENDTVLSLAIDSNTSGFSRIDRIVLRLDLSARTISIAVIKGAPASTPQAPVLTRTSNIHELSLARVQINSGASNVSVTDERGDVAVCGYIKADVKIPTDEMWAQFTSEFNEIKADWQAWFDAQVNQVNPTLYYSETEPLQAVEADLWDMILI